MKKSYEELRQYRPQSHTKPRKFYARSPSVTTSYVSQKAYEPTKTKEDTPPTPKPVDKGDYEMDEDLEPHDDHQENDNTESDTMGDSEESYDHFAYSHANVLEMTIMGLCAISLINH